jgi:chromosome segregation ATPase
VFFFFFLNIERFEMSSALKGANDSEKLADLSSKNYKEQTIWFLNAFWEEFGKNEAEKLWSFKSQMDVLDQANKAEGSSVDEFQAHRFFEKNNETMTVQEMRENLRSTGAITGTLKLVPLTHILIFKYKVNWKELVNAPQGSKEEINQAESLLREVSAAFAEADAKASEAAAAVKEARAKEAEAKSREDEAKRTAAEATKRDEAARSTEAEAKAKEADAREQEAPFKAAQEEVDRALADVKSQEETRDNKTQDLTRKSSEGGVVAQNKAKAELAQHLAEDPLPLRKAKITLEAALKKAEKARAPFEAATKQAEAARAAASEAAKQASAARSAAEAAAKQASDAKSEAEKSRARSEEASRAADAAVEQARVRLDEAEAYLNEVKARMPHGRSWWLEKEIEERKKYLPSRKGGVQK